LSAATLAALFFANSELVGSAGIISLSILGRHAVADDARRKSADQISIVDVHPIGNIRRGELHSFHEWQVGQPWLVCNDAARFVTIKDHIGQPNMLTLVAVIENYLYEKTCLFLGRATIRINELPEARFGLPDGGFHLVILRRKGNGSVVRHDVISPQNEKRALTCVTTSNSIHTIQSTASESWSATLGYAYSGILTTRGAQHCVSEHKPLEPL
jgi:hypothetical protein